MAGILELVKFGRSGASRRVAATVSAPIAQQASRIAPMPPLSRRVEGSLTGTSLSQIWPWRHSVPGRAGPDRSFAHLPGSGTWAARSEEHTSELQSQSNIVCRLLLEK